MNYFSSSSASTPAPSPNKKGTGNPDDQGISGMIADYSKQIYETANGFYDDVYQRMFSGSEASSNSETVTPDKNAQPNYGQRGHATNGAPVNYYQTSIPKYQQSHSNAYNGSQPYQPRIYTPERGHQHQQYYAPSAPTYGYPSSARSQAQYNHYARQRIADVKKEIEYLDATDLRDRHGKKGRCGYCCPTSRRGKWICGLSIFVVLAIIGVFMFVYLPRYVA